MRSDYLNCFVILAIIISAANAAGPCKNSGITFTSFTFSSEIADIRFSPADSSVLYVLTTDHSLYISQDNGVTFSAMLNGTTNVLATEFDFLADGKSIYIITPSGDLGLYNFTTNAWVTGDFGSELVYQVIPNNNNARWLMVITWDASCLTNLMDLNCGLKLYLSTDFGATFTLLSSRVFSAVWGSLPSDNDLILFVNTTNTLLPQFNVSLANRELVVARVSSLSSRNVTTGVSLILNSNEFDLSLIVNSQTFPSGLSLSLNDALSQTSITLSSSMTLDIQSSYSLVSLDPNAILLNALHTGISGNPGTLGDLYVASSSDASFTLSLALNKRSLDGKADVVISEALPSSFIANAFATAALSDLTHANNYIQSFISFNNGGSWDRIRTITNNTLNLFGPVDGVDISTIVTHASAVGLIMASGNEGTYLDLTPGNSNLYVSVDGGLSFGLSLAGDHIFEFSNYGAIMVAMSPTDANATHASVEWSFDQGLNWNQCGFRRPAHFVEQKIITDTLATGTTFLLIGTGGRVANMGAVVRMDFSNKLRTCVGLDLGQNTDFERMDLGCTLGVSENAIVRKRDAQCLVPSNNGVVGVIHTDLSVACHCTIDDYECDGVCFARNSTGQCYNICAGLLNDPFLPPVPCVGSWHRSQGYRLIAGDICQGGLNLLPQLVPCNQTYYYYTAPPPPAPSASGTEGTLNSTDIDLNDLKVHGAEGIVIPIDKFSILFDDDDVEVNCVAQNKCCLIQQPNGSAAPLLSFACVASTASCTVPTGSTLLSSWPVLNCNDCRQIQA